MIATLQNTKERLLNFILACSNGVDDTQNNGFFGKVSPAVIDDAMQVLKDSLKPGMSVLDIGCGNGYALDRFKEMGLETHGITMNPEEQANAVAKGHDVRLMDMTFMDMEDESYDVVWARHVIEHSVVPYYIVSECHRLLKPGGIFYFEIPSPSDRGYHEGNLYHYSVMPIRMWLALLHRAGFQKPNVYDIKFGEADKYHSLIARK